MPTTSTMADSSKHQRDFDLESWDDVTESGVNSPAASSRAGYLDISYQGMMPHVEPPFFRVWERILQ